MITIVIHGIVATISTYALCALGRPRREHAGDLAIINHDTHNNNNDNNNNNNMYHYYVYYCQHYYHYHYYYYNYCLYYHRYFQYACTVGRPRREHAGDLALQGGGGLADLARPSRCICMYVCM